MSDIDEEVSLQDDLREALEEVAADDQEFLDSLPPKEEAKPKAEDPPKDRVEEAKPKAEDQPKDKVEEAKPKAEDQPKDKVEGEQTKDQKSTWTQDKAPQSWSPKARERWADIPADIRQEIVRREEASVQGVRKLQQEFEPYKNFVEPLVPFIQEAAQHNVNASVYIGNVMKAEAGLRTGTAEQRFSALLDIADSYQIPLRELLSKTVGDDVLSKVAPAKVQLPPEIQRELDESRRFREEMRQGQQRQEGPSEVEASVVEFAKNHEFFEDLREDMATLIDMGKATDLEGAYNLALKYNEEVQGVLAARRAKDTELKGKQAKAAGASPKSKSSDVDVKVDKDEDDDLHSTIRKQWESQSGRT